VEPGCEETFNKTKDLINHFRAEHNAVLSCPHCNKEVKYGAGLIHHVRIHTGERPYFCPVSGCTFRSATKNNLKVHLSGKLHGWDVLMQFAHIFDRPKKKRHYSDLPDIIVKRQKTQLKGMQPMMNQMNMGMPGMMGMPMMVRGGQQGQGLSPGKVPSPNASAGLPPQIQIPQGIQKGIMPEVALKDAMKIDLNLKLETPSAADIAQASLKQSTLSILATGSPGAQDAKEEKTAIISSNEMAVENAIA